MLRQLFTIYIDHIIGAHKPLTCIGAVEHSPQCLVYLCSQQSPPYEKIAYKVHLQKHPLGSATCLKFLAFAKASSTCLIGYNRKISRLTSYKTHTRCVCFICTNIDGQTFLMGMMRYALLGCYDMCLGLKYGVFKATFYRDRTQHITQLRRLTAIRTMIVSPCKAMAIESRVNIYLWIATSLKSVYQVEKYVV